MRQILYKKTATHIKSLETAQNVRLLPNTELFMTHQLYYKKRLCLRSHKIQMQQMFFLITWPQDCKHDGSCFRRQDLFK